MKLLFKNANIFGKGKSDMLVSDSVIVDICANISENNADEVFDLNGINTNPTENNKTICNIEATANKEFATTDLEWGGSKFFDIEPQQIVEIVIYYEGIVDSLLVMLDSFIFEDTSTHSGLAEIFDIKFVKLGELYLPSNITL